MKSLIRGKDIQPDDALDRIFKAWVTDKTHELTLQDTWLLERMEYADAIMREGGERSRYTMMVNEMMAFFKHQNLTKRTIENDIARAKRFFLATRPREDKEYARGIHLEWLHRLIWKAEDAGDFRAAAALMKEKGEIEAFKKVEMDLPDMNAIQPPPVLITMNPQDIDLPVIENLEERLKALMTPKKDEKRNNQAFDEAEVVDGTD
jgi:hypothetical protein